MASSASSPGKPSTQRACWHDVVASISVETWLGLAAALTAVAGLAMTVFGYVTGRKDATKKAEQICHEKLLEEQRVSEKLSDELHALRAEMRRGRP